MTLAPPSPRARGEGGVRGRRRCLSVASHRQVAKTLPVSSESRHRPLNPSFSPHAGEGAASGITEVTDTRSRSRDAPAPEVCRPKPRILSPQRNEGRRSAEMAQLSRGASPRDQMLPPARASGAAARWTQRARLSALHRGSRQAVTPDAAPGRVSWNRRVQTGGPSPAPVQRAPRGPVIVPDERGPEAARERTVSVRARAPRPLPQPGAPS